MFHKNLADLVKGLRSHKKDERQFIAACLKEIKEELKSTDNELKVFLPLTTLHLYSRAV